MIRDATPADASALYRICLLTGDAGGDATALHADPDLLGEVYVGPYLHVAPAVAAMAEDQDGAALGYVVGTPDTGAFAAACEAEWWPSLRGRYPLVAGGGSPPRTTADQSLIEFLHHPPATGTSLTGTYSAHLHIDLLPSAQGRGIGRALMGQMIARLHAAGATGVHLGVDARNTRALAFYERLGFTRWGWGSAPDAVTLVRPLL